MSMERSKWLCKCLNLNTQRFISMLKYDLNISLFILWNELIVKKYARLVWRSAGLSCHGSGKGFDLQFNMGTISCVLPDPVNRVNISDSTYRNYSDVPHSVKLFLLWELNWLSKCKYVGTEFRSSWERREEIMMLLLSNCRLSIVRLTPSSFPRQTSQV